MEALKTYVLIVTTWLVLLICLLQATNVYSQNTLSQTIKGVVIDRDSKATLPGASIVLSGSDPIHGCTSDAQGRFILTEVPVGRQNLEVNYVGYQTQILKDIIVRSGKEVVLEILLQEMVINIQEVNVRAANSKDRPINSVATVSARSFNLDETNRYAGSYGDPARMVANYAGVMSSRDNRNDIVIRGNSPIGLQYQLNGIQIANPNHFGATGTTGGPITMLNTNLMANSDFLTGAFPAEYGNAMSGIFDIKLRTGNNSKREHWAQIGWNGLEFGTEGPFSKKGNASYVAAYRYSFIHLLELMGIKFKESAQYQDLSFNLVFPTKKSGVFSLMGIGGTSAIKINDSEKSSNDWTFKTHGEDIETASALGTIGLNHHYQINKRTRIHSSISFVGSQISSTVDTFSINQPKAFIQAGESTSEYKLNLTSRLNRKINPKDKLAFGLSYDYSMVSYADSQYYHHQYTYQTNSKGSYGLLQAYSQWQHAFNNGLSGYFGLHFLHLSLNQTTSLEPRAGIKWQLNPIHSFSLGAGLHGQMQAGVLYYVTSPLSTGEETELTNKNLKLSKSLQFVLAWDALLNEHLRLKTEAYYQHLYDIPVKESIPQFSALNLGTAYYLDREDSLISEGVGRNYGLELTLERFVHKGFFYLLTASLFQSQYQGFDGITRSTSFNGNYVFNGVAGYEIPLGNKRRRNLILGLRLTWAGGRPYIPYDVDATVAAGEVIYDWDKAYSVRHDDYVRGSFRVGMRRNMKKMTMEFVLDLQYRADYTYVYLYRIDVLTGEVVQDYNMGFYPTSAVRIMF